MNKDYYEILGVQKNASKDDIKRAYRKLAHKFHPDKGGGDESKFKEVSEAYQILSDDQKRGQYDQFGSSGFSGGGPSSGWDFSGFGNQGFNTEDLGDIFESFFGGFGGGRRQSASRRRGSDISIGIDVSFQEAVFGSKRSILIQHTAECESCTGSGAEKGAGKKKCQSCQGTGTVRESRGSIFGSFTSLTECGTCAGAGEVPEKICNSCKGLGIRR